MSIFYLSQRLPNKPTPLMSVFFSIGIFKLFRYQRLGQRNLIYLLASIKALNSFHFINPNSIQSQLSRPRYFFCIEYRFGSEVGIALNSPSFVLYTSIVLFFNVNRSLSLIFVNQFLYKNPLKNFLKMVDLFKEIITYK